MAGENKTYEDLLKSLRIALTSTSVYFKEHPLFVKSVDTLRRNINVFLFSMNSLRVGIAPDSLLIGKDRLKGARLYEELAVFFHRRKVKTIIFNKGLDNKELIHFLISANSSSKDILFKGGLGNILREAYLKYIRVEDLDYSQLLRDEGEEYSDIWLFLLKKSLKQGDSEGVNNLTNDFKKMLKKLQVEDLVENNEVREGISELLNYLKAQDFDKFSQCSQELTKVVLEKGSQLNEGQVTKLKTLLKEMDIRDISSALLDQLQSSDKFDPLSLNLFSKIVDRGKHKGVTMFLADKLEEDEELKKNSNVIAGIKELITLPDFLTYESKTYHDRLVAILDSIFLGEGFRFSRSEVAENYRLILLDLFVLEPSPKRLALVLATILYELDKTLKANNLKYIRSFKKALDQKKEAEDFESNFPEASKEISAFIEKAIFDEDYASDLGFLVDMVDSTSTVAAAYLDKMFREGKINAQILKLFFKLFPEQLPLFCTDLDKKVSDLRFTEKLMKSLTIVEPALSSEILKHIFSTANNFVKIKVLEKMGELGIRDEGFLFSIISKGDLLQRKKVLSLLVKNSSSCSKAAEMLLSITNPFGLRSKIIEENLKLVGAVPFPEARTYLIALSKYRFFWNKKIRMMAKEILNKNGIRTN